MRLLFLAFFFVSLPCLGQYFPRGISLNDGYLPNLDEPDKWIIAVDGIYDWQKEKSSTAQSSHPTTRTGFNLFYGGQKFRAGLQVLHDFNQDVKDLSLGFGMAFNRPLFFEVGGGYVTRSADSFSADGFSVNGRLGYYWNWITQVKYRVRLRVSLMYNFKKFNDVGDSSITTFHPFIGLEFET